jgi:RND family efflux transporter MFP subunit
MMILNASEDEQLMVSSLRPMARLFVSILLLGLITTITACTKTQPKLAATKPTEVIVTKPIQSLVTDYEDFTGRTEAIQTVQVRARVTGYLDRIHFKDGTDIKEGSPLFDIDPRVYTASVEQAKAQVALAKAHFERVTRDYERGKILFNSKAIGEEEVDKLGGDRLEAEASVGVSTAALKLSQTSLDFTKIAAPISGRLSKRMIDQGNLVKADDTILTTIVSLDPLYVSFDIDERSLLRIRRLVREGKVASARETEVHVKIGLADDDGYSLDGIMNFVDNVVDANTGTLRVRATVANPKLLLSPGLFVRVRLPIGNEHQAILVPEEALGSDQGQKYIFVVNAQDEVVYRRVKTGQQVERNRVIDDGVNLEDRVIVQGMQRVRAGVKVTPKTNEEFKKAALEKTAKSEKKLDPASEIAPDPKEVIKPKS